MKRTEIVLFALIIFSFGFMPSFAQQLAQYSQYLHNPILLNPATAGINNNLNLDLSYRNQWTGFTDAPKTSYISVHGLLFKEKQSAVLRTSRPGFTTVKKTENKMDHGVGGIVITDKYGAFSNTSGYLAYALHLGLTRKLNLSFGLAGGVSNWKMDEQEISLADPNDATYNYLLSQSLSKTFFDLNSGLWVYTSEFYIGYSTSQLLQSQIRSIDIPLEAKANAHHFITGGYKFLINEDLILTPSVLLKFMSPAPATLDINVKANYQNKIWGGLSYRNHDAIVAIIGYNIVDRVNVGYSYDITLSELKNYSSGSHEIVISVKFFKDTQSSSISFL
ncbi:MAG TPA: type IX secretion system membrane protein PorP/SprF [Flavobacteriales bacterium]|nr:type IX secretion system membrane protein PorP/SprF [Flavobacteriales bacterium]